MIGAIAPTAMFFVPSVHGISHNVKEYTAPENLENGSNVLLQVLLKLVFQGTRFKHLRIEGVSDRVGYGISQRAFKKNEMQCIISSVHSIA